MRICLINVYTALKSLRNKLWNVGFITVFSEFRMTAFKSTAEVTLTNWFQISIVKHCIMSLFWISPKSGLLSYFTLWSHLQHDSKEPAGERFTEDRWVKEITANYDGWYGGASDGDRHRRSFVVKVCPCDSIHGFRLEVPVSIRLEKLRNVQRRSGGLALEVITMKVCCCIESWKTWGSETDEAEQVQWLGLGL